MGRLDQDQPQSRGRRDLAWAGLAAIQKGQVIGLDDDVASRWGPRVVDLVKSITDAVAQVPAS